MLDYQLLWPAQPLGLRSGDTSLEIRLKDSDLGLGFRVWKLELED